MKVLTTLVALAVGVAPATATAGCTDAAPADPTRSGRRLPLVRRQTYRPGLAAALNILPGAGYLYLCDPAGTVTELGVAAGSFVAAVGIAGDPTTLDDPLATTAAFAVQNTWFYGIYDSYRLASLLRGPRPDRQPVDDATVAEHLAAPFELASLRDPLVIAAAAAGVGITVFQVDVAGGPIRPLWSRHTVPWADQQIDPIAGTALYEALMASIFDGVGPGEEGLFRGTIQPVLVNAVGPVAGIAGASLLFGAAHYANAGGDVRAGLEYAAVTGTFGAALGIVAQHDRYVLRRPIAMHFWYDMAVGTAAWVLVPDQPIYFQFSGTL